MAPPLEIRHDEAASRFEALVAGHHAECAYHRRGDTLLMTHTEVPSALQGQGVAGQLVRAALNWARAEGLKVRPLCSYVADYMRRHPETDDLLAP